jgi:hypothetical protein
LDRDLPSSYHSDLTNFSPSKAKSGLHYETIAKGSPLSITEQYYSLSQELKINTSDSPKFKPDLTNIFTEK